MHLEDRAEQSVLTEHSDGTQESTWATTTGTGLDAKSFTKVYLPLPFRIIATATTIL